MQPKSAPYLIGLGALARAFFSFLRAPHIKGGSEARATRLRTPSLFW